MFFVDRLYRDWIQWSVVSRLGLKFRIRKLQQRDCADSVPSDNSVTNRTQAGHNIVIVPERDLFWGDREGVCRVGDEGVDLNLWHKD